jgi:hypothetical protein
MSADLGIPERWAAIARTGGLYQISSQGRVRRTKALRRGTLEAWGLVHCKPNNHGYLMFNTTIAGKSFNVAVHLLVLTAFVGPRPQGLQGAHLNGRRADARLENLAWVTPVENNSHKILHGTTNQGERCHLAKVTDADVMNIRATGSRNTEIAVQYGITAGHVGDIRKGLVWKHLPLAPGARVDRRLASA